MAFVPTMADIQELDKQISQKAPAQQPGEFQPTMADIQALGGVPAADAPSAQLPEGTPRTFLDKVGRAGGALMSIPGALYRMGVGDVQEFRESPSQFTKDILEGGAKTGIDMLNTAAQTAQLMPQLGGMWRPEQFVPGELRRELKAMPSFEPERPMTAATQTGELAASMLPITRVGSLTESLARMAMDELPEFFGRSLVEGVTAGALTGTAIAPMTGMDTEESALMGAILPAGLQPLSKGLRGLIRGKATPEEFAEARAQVPEGLKMPIGELAESPAMVDAYQKAQGLWGSGAAKPYQQLNAYLDEGINEVLSDVPENVTNPNQYVYDDMLANYTAAKARTSDAYEKLAERADAREYDFDATAFNQKATDLLNALQDEMVSDTLARELAPTLEKLRGFSTASIPTFKKAISLDKGLTRLISKVGVEDRDLARQLQELKSSLNESFDTSAEAHPELYDDYLAAKQARVEQGKFEKLDRKTKSPFFKIYEKGPEALTDNFISDYLKASNNLKDKGGLLEKLTAHISPEARDVIKDTYLKDAQGEESTVAKALNLTEKLSDRQLNALFDEDTAQMKELINLGKLFPEAKSAALEPKTGFAGSKGTQKMGGLGAAAALGATGHMLPAAIAALGIPAIGQTLQRVLRSEALKNAYEGALKKKGAPVDTQLVNTLRAIASQQGAQQ